MSITSIKNRHPLASLLLTALAIRLLCLFLPDGFSDGVSYTENLSGVLIHRLFYMITSLFTIAFTYRMSELFSSKRTAWNIGAVVAFCLIRPNLSFVTDPCVFTSLPFMLYGCLIVLRQEMLRQASLNENIHRTSFIIAGMVMAVGVAVWLNACLIVLPILLILIFRSKKSALFMAAGFTVTAVIIFAATYFIAHTTTYKILDNLL